MKMGMDEIKNAQFYADLARLSEDDRIDLIGRHCLDTDEAVAILTDSDAGKADRYIEKLTTRFPGVEIVERGDGPVKDTVYFKARKKAH